MRVPDIATLSLCSILQATAFGFVFTVLWLRSRGARHYAAWAVASLLYAVAVVLLSMTSGPGPLSILLILALIGFSNVLPLAGALSLEGRPIRPRIFAASAAGPIGYGLPTFLSQIGLIGDHHALQVIGEAVGLAVSVAVPGTLLAFGAGSELSLGRRIAGCAMLGYLPAYVLSIWAEFMSLPGYELIPLFGLISDQVLLGMISLGLLSIPVEQVQRQLRDAALRDPLTGCWNRAGLAKLAATYLHPDTAVIALDVDHFKQVNDRYGHAAGDEVLMFIGEEARLLAHTFDGQISRVGGDEFVILLPAGNVDPSRFTVLLQDRLRARSLLGTGWSVSVGVAQVCESDTSLDDATLRADAALYRAKAERCASPPASLATPLEAALGSIVVQSLAAASSASK